MKCPVCASTNLVMSERQGVEIDYCPECRGVWLDRGELDKIIERAAQHEMPSPSQPYPHQPMPYGNRPSSGHGHDQGYGHGYGHGHKPYKRKSFLEELFD